MKVHRDFFMKIECQILKNYYFETNQLLFSKSVNFQLPEFTNYKLGEHLISWRFQTTKPVLSRKKSINV